MTIRVQRGAYVFELMLQADTLENVAQFLNVQLLMWLVYLAIKLIEQTLV